MTYTKFFSFALVGICLSACGGNNGDNKETSDSTAVSDNELTLQVEPQLGELGNYLSISDPSVKFIRSEEVDGADTSIVIKSNVAINVNQAVATDGYFALEIAILDKNHNEIDFLRYYDFSIDNQTDYDAEDFNHYLSPGTLRATFNHKIKKEKWDKRHKSGWGKALAEGGYIVLKPASITENIRPYGSTSSASPVADNVTSDDNSTGGTSDWDEALDSYEQYVDKYIAMMKKAANGDMSAVSEVDGLMKEAQNFEKKFNASKDFLSPAQAQRYLQITQKMTKM